MNDLKKKSKALTKRFAVIAVLIAALSGAVYLNYLYSAGGSLDLTAALTAEQQPTTVKYIGQAEYVNAQTMTTGYFEQARLTRDNQRKKSIETLREVVDSVKSGDTARNEAVKEIKLLTKRSENENTIETLLSAKKFSKCVAVIGEKSISVIVSAGKSGLQPSKTAQIQDAVTSTVDISLENIKIIEIK